RGAGEGRAVDAVAGLLGSRGRDGRSVPGVPPRRRRCRTVVGLRLEGSRAVAMRRAAVVRSAARTAVERAGPRVEARARHVVGSVVRALAVPLAFRWCALEVFRRRRPKPWGCEGLVALGEPRVPRGQVGAILEGAFEGVRL